MPAGKTHDAINMFSLPIFLFLLFWVGALSIHHALSFVFGFLFGTYLCGPDLDIKSNVYKRWGLFRFIWIPYHRFFSHRSIFTHGILIGDIIRIFYLFGWGFVLFILPSFLRRLIDAQTWKGLGIIVFVLLSVWIIFNIIRKKGYFYQTFKGPLLGQFMSISLLLLFFAIFFFSLSFIEWLKDLWDKDPWYIWFFPIGIILSSTLHSLSDYLVSAYKKYPKQMIAILVVGMVALIGMAFYHL